MYDFLQARLLRAPRTWAFDALLLAAVAAILYVLLTVAPREIGRVTPSVTIDLHPSALPQYTLLSFLRMCAAYAASLLFTFVAGYAAAHSRIARRVLVPLLDLLQSIPVLSFLPAVLLAMIALFPRQTIGLEVGSIVLIFTGMVWNMAFSFYHSMLSIPEELIEASRAFRQSWWQRFTTLELPASVIGLVWNSMMSWAGGWFFLMATEAFTLSNKSYTLPGLGSYLAAAANKGDFGAIAWGLGVLVAVIIVLDQLVWRPLIAWSERFKVELAESQDVATSWYLELLQHSALLPWLARQIHVLFRPIRTRRPARQLAPSQPRSLPLARFAPVLLYVIGGVTVIAVVWGSLSLFRLLVALPLAKWVDISKGAVATLIRVEVALGIALAWCVPVGVAIGLRPRVARIAQPLAQIAASVPATAVFPILLLVIIRLGGGLSIASILLMLLGTQWYVLFNAIAGAISLPQDLQDATVLLKVRGWMRWRSLILPGIFPHLVTGGITAQGGAFNASIVSEYVVFQERTLQTIGLGALISTGANTSDYSLLAAATVAMGILVIVLHRMFWRKAARLAEERYHL